MISFSFMRMALFAITAVLAGMLAISKASAERLAREALGSYIRAPFSVGEQINDKGVYKLLNSGGIEAGYIFETEPLAPLPGFSGATINVLVVLDLEGNFMDVQLVSHNEPIFVSGLGEAPFHNFFVQYGGLSISDTIVVGTPYGEGASGSSLVYLDGVTKATASVRIAHESVMGAALAVAREKMQGISLEPPAFPNLEYDEDLTWKDLVEKGIATRKTVSNAEINKLFAGTIWEDDDPEATDYPEETYLDFWVVDVGPPSIARAALSEDTYEELRAFLEISPNEEPLLVIETARHGLVSPDFVRNTSPDWISAEQDGLPITFRDADLLVETTEDAPDGTAMILRTDRRLGFDPARDYLLKVLSVREHGMFQPETGSVAIEIPHGTPERFFDRIEQVKPMPPWLEALWNRQADMIALGVFLLLIVALLAPGMNKMADARHFKAIRLCILGVVIAFIGWWGQGQLSIVTALGALRTAVDGGSFAFLLYDPFSLLIWVATVLGFIAWGRGLFCGWLCPFGAMQEFAHHIGKLLRVPQIEPSARWDQRLKWFKFPVLAALIAVVFIAPNHVDKAAEVEPFKTAITTFFIREWYYVAYAVFWLLLGMVLFKGFCRYVCPLGAVMVIGGLFRGRDWIKRRQECGTPCQLCKVKCQYNAIDKSGAIQYSECFQCLDCVSIHNDKARCVPLVLAERQELRQAPA